MITVSNKIVWAILTMALATLVSLIIYLIFDMTMLDLPLGYSILCFMLVGIGLAETIKLRGTRVK